MQARAPAFPAVSLGLGQHRGVSQAALAAAGITTAHVSQLEAGKRQPSVEVLWTMAHKLAVDMEDLLSRAAD